MFKPRTDRQLELANEEATIAFAQSLSKELVEGDIVYLEGPLGAGKTFFSQALIRLLGHSGKVLSPTYSLVQSYDIELRTENKQTRPNTVKLQLHHFDLYRLSDPEELEYIGIRDYINQHDICLIEWPSKGGTFIPDANLRISLDYAPNNANKRKVQVSFLS